MNTCQQSVSQDYDPIFTSDTKQIHETGDLYQLSHKFYDTINLKIGLLLFLTYYILNTDIFIEKGLSRIFCNVYDSTQDKFTEKGIIVSGILLSLFYIFYDLLDKKKII